MDNTQATLPFLCQSKHPKIRVLVSFFFAVWDSELVIAFGGWRVQGGIEVYWTISRQPILSMGLSHSPNNLSSERVRPMCLPSERDRKWFKPPQEEVSGASYANRGISFRTLLWKKCFRSRGFPYLRCVLQFQLYCFIYI